MGSYGVHSSRSAARGLSPRVSMAHIREWIDRLRGTLRPRRSDLELQEELRLHLQFAAEEAQRRGDSPAGAARTAAIKPAEWLRRWRPSATSADFRGAGVSLATCMRPVVDSSESPVFPPSPSPP